MLADVRLATVRENARRPLCVATPEARMRLRNNAPVVCQRYQ